MGDRRAGEHTAAFIRVLEEHLRKLCQKHGILTEEKGQFRKAAALNRDLRTREVYNLLEQKNVTTWLGLRNEMPHMVITPTMMRGRLSC